MSSVLEFFFPRFQPNSARQRQTAPNSANWAKRNCLSTGKMPIFGLQTKGGQSPQAGHLERTKRTFIAK